MAVGTGSATITFPASAGSGTNITSVNITGISTITSTSSIEAFIMGSDSTADHNAYEHEVSDIALSIDNIIPGTGFTINAISHQRLEGTFKVRYVWSS